MVKLRYDVLSSFGPRPGVELPDWSYGMRHVSVPVQRRNTDEVAELIDAAIRHAWERQRREQENADEALEAEEDAALLASADGPEPHP